MSSLLKVRMSGGISRKGKFTAGNSRYPPRYSTICLSHRKRRADWVRAVFVALENERQNTSCASSVRRRIGRRKKDSGKFNFSQIALITSGRGLVLPLMYWDIATGVRFSMFAKAAL